jgi:hypothetical protein
MQRTDITKALTRSHSSTARANDLQLHLPALCLTEGRHAIMNKCQPRYEANAIRQFLARAKSEQTVSADQARAARDVLDLFERQVQTEIGQLDDVLSSLHTMAGLEQFPLNEPMLERAIDLARSNLFLKPFDQAIWLRFWSAPRNSARPARQICAFARWMPTCSRGPIAAGLSSH